MSRIERPGPSEQFSSLRHGDVVVLECDGPPGKHRISHRSTHPLVLWCLRMTQLSSFMMHSCRITCLAK